MITTVPTEPFLLDGTRNLYLENLLFDNPDAALKWMDESSPALENHLNFLLEAGEDIEAIPYCPYCKKNKVKSFVFVGGVASYELTSCNSRECRRQLFKNSPSGVVFPISTSTLFLFADQPEYKRRIGKLIKDMLGLGREASADKILSKMVENYRNRSVLLAS